MIKKLPLFVFCLSLFLSNVFLAQEKFEEKSYYLIDSLNLETLSENDRYVVDTCLKLYYYRQTDSAKINAISILIGNTFDERIWSKYNDWLHVFVIDKLKNTKKNTFYYSYFKSKEAMVLNNKGYFFIKRKPSLALSFFNKSLLIEKSLDNKLGIAVSYNNIAGVYNYQGKISLALNYYFNSAKLKEKIGHKEGVANSYYHIGLIYNDQNNLELALKYFEKSLFFQIELMDNQGRANSLIGIASVYRKKGELNSAINYLKKGIKIFKDLGSNSEIIEAYISLGVINKEISKFNLAELNFQKSLKIAKELKDLNGMTKSLENLGRLKKDKGNLREAKINGELALKMAKEIGFPKEISKSALLLREIAFERKDYKTAFEMYTLEIKMRDSINNETNYKSLINQQANYEYEKKKATDSVKNTEAKKVYLANLNSVKLENEKKTLEVVSQRKQNIYLYICLFLATILSIFMYNRYKVSQRQRNTIEEQKIAVEEQKEQIETQHLELEGTHREINDSIKYAERLQLAIFPSKENLDRNLNKYFVLFKPKDVVSGDFYWLQKIDNQTYFAVADCTGHGVPGAMVSVVCSNSLNRSVKEFKLTEPKHILNKTRELVIETFAQSGKDIKDGMDITLCSHSGDENKITFSGANNPLWIVRETKYLTESQKEGRSSCIGSQFSLIEYKANKQPIGLYAKMTSFNQTEIKLFRNDTLYLFTDGYADQFGGENSKKFKSKNFKKLLLDTNKDDLNIQKEEIDDMFNEWKGELEQLDDICVVGIKV